MSQSLLNAWILIPHHTKTSKSPFNLHSKGFGFHFPIANRSKSRRFSNRIACEKMGDGFYMRRCVELARTAIGCTSPNPMVGCVIVDGGGEIVGEGFHPKAGQPHAEVFALTKAGRLAENATVYVILEPCNHYGRAPPCTEALISAKVKQVVVGMEDPKPIAASKGIEKIRASGIDVTVGVEELLCQKLNEACTHRIRTQGPLVAVRYSLSYNGGVLNRLGRGAEESGGYYSKLLQEYDGIISSSNLLAASPEPGANQPIQIIIVSGKGSSLGLPDSFTKLSARIIVFAKKIP